MYGLLGWALDWWLGTSWLVVVGILVGAGFGIYMTWARFNKPWSDLDTTPAGPETGPPTGNAERTDSTD